MSTRTIADDLGFAAARDGDRMAVIAGDREVSYGELDSLAGGVAAGLREHGVKRGDRVSILLPNGIAAVVAIQGVLRAGAAISPLHPTIKEERLGQVLSDTEPAVVLCDAEHAETARAAAERAGGMPVLSEVEVLAAGGGTVSPAPGDTDLAAIMYTSGSTGGPKGVMLTHRNLAFAADSIIEYLEMSSADRVLCVLPLSFGYGLSQLLICLRVGATLVLEAGFAFPGKVVQLLEQHRITGLPGVPTVFGVLLSLRGLADRELPDLRFLTNAGAALPTSTVADLRRTFPNARLFLMYGQTECIRVSYLPPEQVDARPASAGVPMPGTEAWIEDDQGNVLAPGETGELIVRGPHVMQGYWRDPEATAKRLRPGRSPSERVLATNDLFRRDSDGYLHFVSRRDDIIKSRGEKVAPNDVEDVLHAFPGVREAAVVGAPHDLLGEAVHAHVAPQPGHDLDPAEVRRHCAERLEDYMVPQEVVVHDDLPRTSNGKLDRRALVGG